MVALKADTTNVLPQEIVNLIVDEVLRLKPVSQICATLRTCSLVSRSFAVQSRLYLWSNLEFRLDYAYQKRASKLLRMLEHHTDSRNFVSGIRSINLVYDVSTPKDWVPLEPLGRLESIKKFFRRQRKNDFFHDLLNMLNHPDLRHFGVETRGPLESALEWVKIKHSIEPILIQIFSSKNLKAFSIHNLNMVSLALIPAACFSSAIEDLTIRDITFLYDPLRFPLATPTPTQLRRLELRPSPGFDSTMSRFFSCFPSPTSSSNSISTPPLFPHLQTLVVSLPRWPNDMDSLWKFMAAVAPTLETLDMEYYDRGYAVASVLPLSLCRLTALRHFTFRVIFPRYTSATKSSQEALLGLLASPNPIPKLDSIEICYLLFAASYTYPTKYHTQKMSLIIWRGAPHWSTIDSHINDGEFPCLKSVNISMEERYQLHTCGEAHITPMSTEETRFKYSLGNLFPRLSGNPDISFFTECQIVIQPSRETLGSSTSM